MDWKGAPPPPRAEGPPHAVALCYSSRSSRRLMSELMEGPPPAAGTPERLIAELSASLTGLPGERIDDRVDRGVAMIAEFAGADRVTVTQLSENGARFGRTHQWARPGLARLEDDDPVDSYPWSSRRIFSERQCLVLSTLDDLPAEAARDRELFERQGVRSVAVLPLIVQESVLGSLSCAALTHERHWDADLVNHLQRAGDIVATALAREHAQSTLGWALGFQRLIAELSTTFIDLAAGAIDEHVTSVLERAARFLDLDRSIVAQASGVSGKLEVTHQWVRDERWRNPSFVVEESAPWHAARLRAAQSVIFSHIDELPIDTVGEREFVRRHAPKSGAVFPLVIEGRLIGAVAFGAIRQHRIWPPDIVDRLRFVSQIIASALGRKRADEELRAALADNERLRGRLEAENVYLQTEVQSLHDFEDIVGRSSALRAVLHKVDQVAPSDVPVLLLGETGTGKELIAYAVHSRSPRGSRPLIVVNCAALPPTLVESELFGHEKGAFTGAAQARAGRFELAHGSTLFLDEIGDLDTAMQAKLLRALQGGEIQRLGSSRTQKVDVRVIAATNRDLGAAIRDGRFRADLYYRLTAFPVQVPPLRERREDIPLLVWHFIQSRQRALGRLITQISPRDMDALVAYDWPGNVRELQNVIDRALILSPGPVLRLLEAFSPGHPMPAPDAERPAENLRDTERTHIIDVLERCRWMIEGRGQAADRLGLHPSTLRNRMKKLGIRRPATSEIRNQ